MEKWKMYKIEILPADDNRKEGFDVQGHISMEAVVKALHDANILIRYERVDAVYLTDSGLGYYAKID